MIIMRDDELGFALEEKPGGLFRLVDTTSTGAGDSDDGLIDTFTRRDEAIDAYEKARREVMRDRAAGAS